MKRPKRANLLLLGKINEFFFEDQSTWVFFGKCANKALETGLDTIAEDQVRVEVQTHEDKRQQDRDLAVYRRRLGKLSKRYTVGPFVAKMMGGEELSGAFVTTITRQPGEKIRIMKAVRWPSGQGWTVAEDGAIRFQMGNDGKITRSIDEGRLRDGRRCFTEHYTDLGKGAKMPNQPRRVIELCERLWRDRRHIWTEIAD